MQFCLQFSLVFNDQHLLSNLLQALWILDAFRDVFSSPDLPEQPPFSVPGPPDLQIDNKNLFFCIAFFKLRAQSAFHRQHKKLSQIQRVKNLKNRKIKAHSQNTLLIIIYK